MSELNGADWTVWLAAQRQRAVNLMLILVLLTGLVGLAFSSIRSLVNREVTTNLPYYATAYVAILAIYLARGLSDRLRAQLFLLVMYAFSVFSLYAGWLVSGGRVFLLASIVVAAILAGPATSLIVMLVSLATYAGFGLAYHQGWLTLQELPDPTSGTPIIIEGVGFIMAICMVAASQWLFGRALMAASRANREAQEARQTVSDYARRLEAVNQELEAFSDSVSHDLRAPLRVIDGFSQALEEDAGPRLGEEDLDHLHRVRAAAARMSGLIDGLLRLSRLSRAEMNVQRVDLTTMAERIADDLRARRRESAVELTVAPGLSADGDPDLLHAAMSNLLDNAFKFSSHQAAAHIEVGSRSIDGETVFFVRDDGSGFDIAQSDRLFGAFQRLHRDQDFPGLGIGLATVARIIRRHGGRIWATGEVGHGATFFFTLPAETVPIGPRS